MKLSEAWGSATPMFIAGTVVEAMRVALHCGSMFVLPPRCIVRDKRRHAAGREGVWVVSAAHQSRSLPNQTYNMQVRVGCILLELCLPRTPARETRNIDAMVDYLHPPITL